MAIRQTLLFERVMDQTRLAVIEEGALCELYIEQPDSGNLSGNIYLGTVQRVLPGMNAAFVDIGLDKNGFLAAGDIALDARAQEGLAAALGKSRVDRLVRQGQQLLVQVIKSQPGAKGPRLSSHITMPGRLMVLLSDVGYVSVSKKIADEAERARLRAIGEALAAENGAGLILRTAAQGCDETALRAEYGRLCRLCEDMRSRARHLTAPKLMHDDNDLPARAVRDMLTADVDAVWVDDDACHEQLLRLVRVLAPEYEGRVHRHAGQTPLFDLYRVDSQLEKVLQKYVWLDSGGSLVIEETEALTSVDVNTGKNVGKGDSEEAIFAANCEAARELMRQLRLRDVGGIIVADFINMRCEEHRQALLLLLRECAARDRNRTTVVDITPLGLAELTRKKARQSLSRQLLRPCCICGGDGAVPSFDTEARRIARELWRRRRGGDDTALLVEAAPEVASRLKGIGSPGGAVFVRAVRGMPAGEHRVSPADPSALPDNCDQLK